MVTWKFVYTRQVQKDAKKLNSSGLKSKTLEILKILEDDPLQIAPLFEKLVGELSGAFSRRINIEHRIVCQVIQDKKVVKIIRMRTHYE